jgi:hypothetical protein
MNCWGTSGAQSTGIPWATADTRSKQMAWQADMCDAALQVARSADWRS